MTPSSSSALFKEADSSHYPRKHLAGNTWRPNVVAPPNAIVRERVPPLLDNTTSTSASYSHHNEEEPVSPRRLEMEYTRAASIDIKSTDWQKQVNGLLDIQRTCRLKPSLLHPTVHSFKETLRHIVNCVASLRSSVSSEGVRTVKAVLDALASSPRGVLILEVIVPVLIPKSVSDKKFVADSSMDCLMTAAAVSRPEFQVQTDNFNQSNFKSTILPLVAQMFVEKLPGAKQAARHIMNVATMAFASSTLLVTSSQPVVSPSNKDILATIVRQFLRQHYDMPVAQRQALEKYIIQRLPPTPQRAVSRTGLPKGSRSRTLPPPVERLRSADDKSSMTSLSTLSRENPVQHLNSPKTAPVPTDNGNRLLSSSPRPHLYKTTPLTRPPHLPLPRSQLPTSQNPLHTTSWTARSRLMDTSPHHSSTRRVVEGSGVVPLGPMRSGFPLQRTASFTPTSTIGSCSTVGTRLDSTNHLSTHQTKPASARVQRTDTY